MFSGIGGFELGIQQAYELQQMGTEPQNSTNPKGGTPQHTERPLCIGYSEIDKYAIQIYEKHFNHKNYGNATTINATELPDFDLLVGGFPCQAFSIAGKRAGLDDARGTLFYDIARIAKEKRPQHLLLENVKGLLSHDNGRTFKLIISTFAELGYNMEWQVLNSKNFGVPQNRERVFIIGHLGRCCGRQVFPIGGGSEQATSQIINPLKGKTDYGWHLEQNIYDDKGITRTVKAGGGSGNMPKVIRKLDAQKINVVGTLDQGTWAKRNESIRRVYGTDGLAPTIPTGTGGGVMPKISKDMRIRRLTPTECERLQAYPDSWTEGVSDTQRYKTLGNGVTVNVVQYIIERMYGLADQN